MVQNRRFFIKNTLIGSTALLVTPPVFSGSSEFLKNSFQSKPWIELSKTAYLNNAKEISKMAGGRPVIAVLKNNAYGLGDIQVAKILNESSFISAMALVKDTRALAIRMAGVDKPILLMGDFERANWDKLIRHNIILSVFSEASFQKIENLAKKCKKTVRVALYLDTGLGRMGIPYEQAIAMATEIAKNDVLEMVHTFSTLTTPKDFAKEQIKRFNAIVESLNKMNIQLGVKHLAPSLSLIDISESHQDAVRPGILLHGTFPLEKMEATKRFSMQPTFRLKAPVVRLELLKAGDTIGFSRFYKVENDEWIATLPIGWADGYYSGAENGAKVLISGKLYTVVNVNASHTNISLGSDTNISLGDIATLVGPDCKEISPEGFGELANGHNYLQINYKESIPKKVYEAF